MRDSLWQSQRPWRPQRWADLYSQFVGPRDPVAVDIANDNRGLSSREAAPYGSFSDSRGAATAGEHWLYAFSPINPSLGCTLRLCWMLSDVSTATSSIGIAISAPPTVSSTAMLFPFQDVTPTPAGVWTIHQVLTANLPTSLYTIHDLLRPPVFAYPEFWLELRIPPGQMASIRANTAADSISLALGYYTQPIV